MFAWPPQAEEDRTSLKVRVGATPGLQKSQLFACYRWQMTDKSRRDKFELRRQSDDSVYTFARSRQPDGSVGYKRDDGDYWIVQKPDWGWIAWDEASQSCMGRPWNVLPQEQENFPPEGDWVSRRARSLMFTCSSTFCEQRQRF
jgi:hypothetical protein